MKFDFLHRINFKLVVLHCLASFLLIFAISMLGLINDIELINLVEEKGVIETIKQIELSRVSNYLIWQGFFTHIGIIMAFLFSAFFFFKTKLYLLNSVLVLIGLLIFNFFGFFSLDNIKFITHLMDFGLLINVITLSTIFIILAISIYFYCFLFMRINTSKNK